MGARTLKNGAYILEIDHDRGIVLAHIPNNDYTPYATWAFSKPDASDTYWGHYFASISEAHSDYQERRTENDYR